MKIKILKNGDVSGVKCFAYFGGKDGLGTCNTACQWWRDDYLKDDGCVMWKKEEAIDFGIQEREVRVIK